MDPEATPRAAEAREPLRERRALDLPVGPDPVKAPLEIRRSDRHHPGSPPPEYYEALLQGKKAR